MAQMPPVKIEVDMEMHCPHCQHCTDKREGEKRRVEEERDMSQRQEAWQRAMTMLKNAGFTPEMNDVGNLASYLLGYDAPDDDISIISS